MRAIFLAAIGGFTSAGMSMAAPVLFTQNNHYYDLIQGSFTFEAALADAAARTHNGLQGYLATVTSEDENTFIHEHFGRANQIMTEWRIDGTDGASEGTWVFANGPEAGSQMTYFSWSVNEPNNQFDEDTIQGNWVQNGLWNDLDAGIGQSYIIEYGGLEAVPLPATLPLLALGLGLLGWRFRSV